jgi:molybdopterin converting factor subunit 1
MKGIGMSEIKVSFFATIKDLVGMKETILEVEGNTNVSELKELLVLRFPNIEDAIKTAIIAVNREFAFDEDTIPESAEVAIFPPVSGGGNEPLDVFQVTDREFDISNLISKIITPNTGAVGMFSGIVRGISKRGVIRETNYLEYEAFVPMAEKKMRQIADEIREKWSKVEGVVIVQRIGHLTPGTPTVFVACSSAHRDDGIFEAARYGIDRLKEIVPVWKKEVGPGGEEWIEGEYIPTREDQQDG